MDSPFVMPCGKHKGVRLSQLNERVVACLYLAYSDVNLKMDRGIKADITNECMYDLKRRFGTYADADSFVEEVRDQLVNRRPSKPPKSHKNRKQPVKSSKKKKRMKSNAEHLADFERDREPYTMPNGVTISIPAGTWIDPNEICPFE